MGRLGYYRPAVTSASCPLFRPKRASINAVCTSASCQDRKWEATELLIFIKAIGRRLVQTIAVVKADNMVKAEQAGVTSQVYIWNTFVRLFHWTLVVSFTVASGLSQRWRLIAAPSEV